VLVAESGACSVASGRGMWQFAASVSGSRAVGGVFCGIRSSDVAVRGPCFRLGGGRGRVLRCGAGRVSRLRPRFVGASGMLLTCGCRVRCPNPRAGVVNRGGGRSAASGRGMWQFAAPVSGSRAVGGAFRGIRSWDVAVRGPCFRLGGGRGRVLRCGAGRVSRLRPRFVGASGMLRTCGCRVRCRNPRSGVGIGGAFRGIRSRDVAVRGPCFRFARARGRALWCGVGRVSRLRPRFVGASRVPRSGVENRGRVLRHPVDRARGR